MKLSGWGRFPVHEVNKIAPRSESALIQTVRKGPLIARGNGRAYGDSAINRDCTVQMRHFNKIISFNSDSGQLVVEAGVLLGDVIHAFLPIGYFPFVTPGTKFVTIGGMIAADVHGKNHHLEGSIGQYVEWIDLIDASGTISRCSRQENSDLFLWTIGGMGLTGIILRACIRLRKVESAWIKQNMIPAENLVHAMEIFEQNQSSTYSVAWIDCLSKGNNLGRALVMLGEHALKDDLNPSQRTNPLEVTKTRKINVPVDFPSWSLNRYTVRSFNALYYRNGCNQAGTKLTDWGSYFYPLDAILGWNRIYGRNGFIQFQCVLPLEQSHDGIHELLIAISDAGVGSFLAVLKRLGSQESNFSFPMEGYTLALDFPVNAQSLSLMNTLDEITLAHSGRFYLAKDGRMTRKTLEGSDARMHDFSKMRQSESLESTFNSKQSERLGL